MLLEQAAHSESSFITLTYDDEHLPLVYNPEDGEWVPTLEKSHLQNFMRYVRRDMSKNGLTIRYFASGEYGEKCGRPHYHAIMFGIGPQYREFFATKWKHGFVSAYEANSASMAYVAKYCLKGSADPGEAHEKLVMRAGDEYKRQDRKLIIERSVPIVAPFRISSKRPAIGATLAPNIADSLNPVLSRDLPPGASAPLLNSVRMGGQKYPIDRTLRGHIQKNLIDGGVPQAVLDSAWASTPWSPSGEEARQARAQHDIVISRRHKRNKL